METELDAIKALYEKIGTAQLADVGGSAVRLLRGRVSLVGRTPSRRFCGRFVGVETESDMLPVLRGLAECGAGDVLFIEDRSPAADDALVGELLASAALAQGVEAILVVGAVRDLASLRSIGLPVFSSKVSPISAKAASDRRDWQLPACNSLGPSFGLGDWLFGDEDGIIAISGSNVQAFLKAAVMLDKTEAALAGQLKAGAKLHDLCQLHEFVEGIADLKFTP